MTLVDFAPDWSGAELDLDAYLDRIGYRGDRTPTLATLRALHRAHTTTIPFENLDIMLGRPLPIDVPSLQHKIVRRARGGYCYENAGLFAAALERFGFTAHGMSGRVTLGADALRPATHALLRVTAADDPREWLCDVGFGRGPLEPVELAPDRGEVNQDGWRFRLERHGRVWALFQLGADGWVDRHQFTLNEQYPLDWAVNNHYVSTSPRSPFVARPYVQRFRVDRHDVIDGLTWTTHGPDRVVATRELEPTDLPKILAEHFDIELDDNESTQLARGLWLYRWHRR